MANLALSLPNNSAGDFFVDSTCINCDACRKIAESFTEVDEYSIVYRQPETDDETKRALMALVAWELVCLSFFSLRLQYERCAFAQTEAKSKAFHAKPLRNENRKSQSQEFFLAQASDRQD